MKLFIFPPSSFQREDKTEVTLGNRRKGSQIHVLLNWLITLKTCFESWKRKSLYILFAWYAKLRWEVEWGNTDQPYKNPIIPLLYWSQDKSDYFEYRNRRNGREINFSLININHEDNLKVWAPIQFPESHVNASWGHRLSPPQVERQQLPSLSDKTVQQASKQANSAALSTHPPKINQSEDICTALAIF